MKAIFSGLRWTLSWLACKFVPSANQGHLWILFFQADQSFFHRGGGALFGVRFPNFRTNSKRSPSSRRNNKPLIYATSYDKEWRKQRDRPISCICSFQLKEILSKRKSITLQAFTSESPSVQGVGTDHCEVNVNPPPKRQKHLSSLVEVQCTKISLQFEGWGVWDRWSMRRRNMRDGARCAPTKSPRTSLINKRHFSAISPKQRSKSSEKEKLFSAFKTKKTKN